MGLVWSFCHHSKKALSASTTGSRPKLVVSADGSGVVSHTGSRLPADLADVTGLTGAFTDALRRLRARGTGRITVGLAVMPANGGEATADLALEIAWLQAVEARSGIPAARAGGHDLPDLVPDIDATLIPCHSEKEQAGGGHL
ncbi:hypothetical protein ABIE67_002228 [Streptomyces sp. V4I8]